MLLLVVEGNKKETWQEREEYGGVPYHKRFMEMLELLRPEAKVEVAFPADSDTSLPSIDKLKAFDGVLWTGSSLYVNDPTQAVQRQLTFAEDIFKSGVPFYGSCWGLQIAAVVAGGKVDACKKGRELGIADPIELTGEGIRYPCFKGRKDKFNALCIHLDEVVRLPVNSRILARNEHSEIQAMAIQYRNSEFFGVQYHPEFLISDIVFIIRYMSETLIDEGLFKSEKEIEDFIAKLEKQSDLPESVIDYTAHTQEIKYWLEHVLKT
ncbi:type 1 glutamine amidotransferase [Fulvivirgaceae bacterium BMA10]|uniref:Type 1 glutamine amidotransferase n=1 Tax=Splendidivirga corallicola TaxID=3051826 RepID=A0ABT8KV76_9BACT|nr:type 1 glutamine amidotransferase [Fulvivirgaceae bacterium BMA10]